MMADRPEGWEFMEKMLLAVQRQEGLRQVVLESLDEAHPEAFRRMLRHIQQHDMTRFSATVRAMNGWFGYGWEAASVKEANGVLEKVIRYLENPAACRAAIESGDGQEAYLGLWTVAFRDVDEAIPLAARMLEDASVERRFVAAHMLRLIDLPEAKQTLAAALDDESLHVAACALQALHHSHYRAEEGMAGIPDLFERLERLHARAPKLDTTVEPLVWPWLQVSIGKGTVAWLLCFTLGNRPGTRLLSYIEGMEPYGRARVLELLAKKADKKELDEESRAAILDMAGDASETVRSPAFNVIKKLDLTEPEVEKLEKLLTRKAADLRKNVVTVLSKREPAARLASADRLLAARNAPQRQAGLEILQQAAKNKEVGDEARARAVAFRAQAKSLTEAEERILDSLQDARKKEPTLKDGLGLFDSAARSIPVIPRDVGGVETLAVAAQEALKSLDTLIKANGKLTFKTEYGEDAMIGNAPWGFPGPNASLSLEADLERLPHRALWDQWWCDRPAGLRGEDGMDAVRLVLVLESGTLRKLDHSGIVGAVVNWLFRLHGGEAPVDRLLDAMESSFAKVPDDVRVKPPKQEWDLLGWRGKECWNRWLTMVRMHRTFHAGQWTDEHVRRFWGLLRWFDEPAPTLARARPQLDEVVEAFAVGAANEADVLDHLIGWRGKQNQWHAHSAFEDLGTLTSRKAEPYFRRAPALEGLVDRVRQRILEVELHRGDLPTAASQPALALGCAGGMEALLPLLSALGKEGFARGGYWSYYGDNQLNKTRVFSMLIRSTRPGPNDTPEAFAEAARGSRLTPKRLVELAVYAPQWTRHVERALEWPGLEEGVWWLHAHTKDQQWGVDEDVKTSWTAEASERTPLTAESLLEGAVDVAWFHRAYGTLGEERWNTLNDAAKYASGGGGHKRAMLFADAMRGRLTKEELAGRVEEKRNQDALRALGLLPLPEGPGREEDLLDRYKRIQEFRRTSKQFGSMRQASEKLAASIAQQNLARTAGFPDPIRLEWAMEAKAIEDLADGPLTAEVDGVTVSLALDVWGKPQISVMKNGAPLKAIPPAVKSHADVKALQARRKEVDRQASRMRQSLEQAMCRGDRFAPGELVTLLDHPILAPMLGSLVFIGEGCAGYPVEGGRALEGHDGEARPVRADVMLLIAHPHDLLETGEWHLWQRDCFLRERIQPFKQVFRELYVLTPAEREEESSARYAGHQVNPRQSMALLGGRGWVSRPEEGVQRTFHDEGVTVSIEFNEYWTTPGDVEGLTVESVQFTRKGDWTRLKLADVPPRVFSEAMRDVDLVVSVAHQGGVDPEASASTVEMRSSVLRETCRLMKLQNVTLEPSHAVIQGELSTYSVHLGSGSVHRQPGGYLCIVPVHGQHKGRLFLPFIDDDPRTAEVVSKVLLLAKDKEIKDPIILEQILPRR
jgi:hypothetical protein